MNILVIGGTGTISTAVSKEILKNGHSLYLLNRGNSNIEFEGSITNLISDINDEEHVKALIKDTKFDCVIDFIAFTKSDLERDYRLFNNCTSQFIFISSASVYNKPCRNVFINEATPIKNPFSEYAQNKIECELYLNELYRNDDFPITIVRPSHTYDDKTVPVGVHGYNGSYAIIKRMLEGKPVLISGDGTTLWTVTHSSDVAKGIVGLIGNCRAIGETVQITGDEPITWNQLHKIIADALDVPFKPFYVSSDFLHRAGKYDFRASLIGDKSNNALFDNSKIKSLVPGFHAEISPHVGIKNAVNYVMSHSECQIEDPDFDEYCDRVISSLMTALGK